MSTEIRDRLEAAAGGPAALLDLSSAWRRGRRRRRSQRLALAGGMAVFVIAVAALVMVGRNGSESIGPAVEVPDGTSPIPGLEVAVELPTGSEVGPGRVLGVLPSAHNTTDQTVVDPTCVLDRYTVWLAPAGDEADAWELAPLGHDTPGPPCDGPRDVAPGSTASFPTGLAYVVAQDAATRPLAPGVYVLELRFDEGGSAYAAVTVSDDPTSATTILDRAPGSEDYVSPEQESMYSVWIHDYDPAEAAWLEQAARAPLTDIDLVTTLEYRRGCRVLDLTYRTIQGQSDLERDATVERLMRPQIARFEERMLGGSGTARWFEKLATEMKAGDFERTQTSVDGCQTSVEWTPDSPLPE